MDKKLIILLVVCSCLFIALSAGDAETPSHRREKLILDINSSGKKIEIKVGQEIQIELKAIGSTGYGWYFDKLDNELFQIVSEDKKVVAGEEKNTVGTPVISTWKLRAKVPGSSVIRMSYYRPWEGKDKAVHQFEIRVDIVP